MTMVRSAEAVCIGHPDKLCDLIADQILDDILYEDRNARVAVEVMAAGRRIIVTGEVSASARVRSGIRDSVRTALAASGYKPWWFLVYVWVRHQSQDISDGVTTSLEARAGDDSAYCLQGAGVKAPSTDTPATRPPSGYHCLWCCRTRFAAALMRPVSKERSKASCRTVKHR